MVLSDSYSARFSKVDLVLENFRSAYAWLAKSQLWGINNRFLCILKLLARLNRKFMAKLYICGGSICLHDV